MRQWTYRDDLKDEINQHNKKQGLVNCIDGLRHNGDYFQWAIECSDGELAWFEMHECNTVSQDYLKKLIKLGAVTANTA